MKISIEKLQDALVSFGITDDCAAAAVDVLLLRFTVSSDVAVASAPFNAYHEIVAFQPPSYGRGAPLDKLTDLRSCLRMVVGSSPVSLKRAFHILDLYKLGKVGRYSFELSLRRDFKWKKSTAETWRIFGEIDRKNLGYFTLSEWLIELGSLAYS